MKENEKAQELILDDGWIELLQDWENKALAELEEEKKRSAETD